MSLAEPIKTHDYIAVVGQHKTNALAAKHLHQGRINALRFWCSLTDVLSFGVPTLYFPLRYIVKGTSFQTIAEYIWEGLAALLTVLALVKLIYKWQESADRHSRLRDKNIDAVTQSDVLLRQPTMPDERELRHFYEKMDQLEAEDRDALGTLKPAAERYAYRAALKEVFPGGVNCQVCGASPWKFKPGSCQVCGNTPVQGVKGN